MISVGRAERAVLSCARSFGSETVELATAPGRVLAESVYADRDLPPYDRITMDGFAIAYADFARGQRVFAVQGQQAAGDKPRHLGRGYAVQVATGAVLPTAADTVVPVEDTTLQDGSMTVRTATIHQGQYIHARGSDTKRGRVLVPAGQLLDPVSVALAASTGQTALSVSVLPRIVIVTTGDELVAAEAKPASYQVRQSNNYAIRAALAGYKVSADMLHLPDDMATMRQQLDRCFRRYDAVIITGGVSKGTFDYVPAVLADLLVEIVFHGVKQRPGKPLLFGVHADGPAVFACPGNPVSALLCLSRYVLPWLRKSLGTAPLPDRYAVLDQDLLPPKGLHFFPQVKLRTDTSGVLRAQPVANNGSGDFLSLLGADAFLEIAPGRQARKGETYKVLALKAIM